MIGIEKAHIQSTYMDNGHMSAVSKTIFFVNLVKNGLGAKPDIGQSVRGHLSKQSCKEWKKNVGFSWKSRIGGFFS